jgi:hypothetical protein
MLNFFASENRTPVVYEVEPDGEIEPDPDCKVGVSFACREAKMVGTHNMRGKTINNREHDDGPVASPRASEMFVTQRRSQAELPGTFFE